MQRFDRRTSNVTSKAAAAVIALLISSHVAACQLYGKSQDRQQRIAKAKAWYVGFDWEIHTDLRTSCVGARCTSRWANEADGVPCQYVDEAEGTAVEQRRTWRIA